LWIVAVLRVLKRQVEQYPALALTYRTLRDALAQRRQSFVETPFGFRLKGDSAMQDGTFESREIHLITALLDSSDVFVDVGANVGLYTCLARQAGKHTLAVEPLQANLRYLFANLEQNGWSDVEVWPIALADSAGTSSLSGASTGASLLSGWAGASPLLRSPVAVSTLDTILGSRFAGQRLVIKIDVEGAEWRVLKGAEGILRSSPAPTWLIEINLTENHPNGTNPHYLETFQMLWSRGYRSQTVDNRAISRLDVEAWVRSPATAAANGNVLFTMP
jgi:FkbM family methyltransferase